MKDEVIWDITLRLSRRQLGVLKQCLNPLIKGTRRELKQAIADLEYLEAELERAEKEVFAP